MNQQTRITALDELIESVGVDATIKLLADRIQARAEGSADPVDRARCVDRANELRDITRTAAEVLVAL